MIRFNNDYNHGAHPSILKALADTNGTSYGGYGEDEWCDNASFIIRNLLDRPDAEVKLFPGATQANFIVIDAALSPIQSVIAADTGHINCHELHPSRTQGTRFYSFRIRTEKSQPARLMTVPLPTTMRTSLNT